MSYRFICTMYNFSCLKVFFHAYNACFFMYLTLLPGRHDSNRQCILTQWEFRPSRCIIPKSIKVCLLYCANWLTLERAMMCSDFYTGAQWPTSRLQLLYFYTGAQWPTSRLQLLYFYTGAQWPTSRLQLLYFYTGAQWPTSRLQLRLLICQETD